MTCSDISSGALVVLSYIEEKDCGITPAGLTTTTTDMVGDKSGAGAGEMNFTEAGTDFIALGYLPYQYCITAGFDDVNNGTWRIKSVTTTTVTVFDPDGVGSDEPTAVGQTIKLTMSVLRATSRQIDSNVEVLESSEVRPDAQFSVVRHGFTTIEGSPGFELSLNSYDDFIRGAQSAEWTTIDLSGTGNLGMTAATPSAKQATLSRVTGDWEDDGIRPGDVITLAGFTAGAVPNNKQWTVLSVSGTDAVLSDNGEVAQTVAPGVGPTAVYPGKRIDIGKVIRTYTIEQGFTDIDEYRVFRGNAIMEWAVNLSPQNMVEGSFNTLGLSDSDFTGASIITELPVSPETTQPFGSFEGEIHVDDAVSALVTGLDFTVNTNRTTEAVIGSRFSPAVFAGRIGVEGTATIFFEDGVQFNKFRNETEVTIYTRMDDADDPNEFISIVMPRVKYISGTFDPPAEGPVPQEFGFRSLVKEVAAVGVDTVTTTSMTVQVSNTP